MGRLLIVLALLPTALLGGCRPGALWSPDGKRLALEVRGALYTHDVASKRFRSYQTGPGRALSPAWSPDGRRLAFYRATLQKDEVRGLALALLDVASGSVRTIAPGLSGPVPRRQEEGRLVIDLVNRVEPVREILGAAWSPDGSRLAYTGYSGSDPVIYVGGPAGEGARLWTVQGRHGFRPSWSPDGRRLAYIAIGRGTPAEDDGKPALSLEVANADGSSRRVLVASGKGTPPSMLATSPLWSGDGSTLFYISDVQGQGESPLPEACEIWSVPVAGGEPRKVRSLDAPGALLDWGRDRAVFFFGPENAMETEPRLGLLAPLAGEPAVIKPITRQMLGQKEGADNEEVDNFPVPSLSPDGRTAAILFVPKSGPATLLQVSLTGGPDLRLQVPVPAARPAPLRSAPPRRPSKPKK